MKSVEKLNFVKLEDQFPQNFFAYDNTNFTQKDGFFLVGKEDDSEVPVGFGLVDFGHEELEVIDVKLRIEEFPFTGRVFPAGVFTHIFLAAVFTVRFCI
jgi:hypothetical protein